MSYIDPATMVAQYQALGSTLSNLGQELSQSTSPAAFPDVLAQMQDALSSVGSSSDASSTSSASNASSTTSLASAYLPTSSLLDPSTSTSALSAATLGEGSAASTVTGADVVADAAQYIGVPYQWGGTSASTGFDCSGLVQHVYGDLGVSLPRTSEEQATAGTPVASLADAQPGDLVFFAGSDGTAASPGHVGIYIGNGEMIDAPHTGTTVQVQPVGQPTEIRRILPSSDGSSADLTSSLLGTTDTAGLSSAASSASSDAIPASLGVPASLTSIFEQAGQTSGVSPALLAAVAKQESGFQPDAVSPSGAEGMMQLMPSTAAGLGANPFDPTQAVDAAASMLKGYLTQYNGSVPLALAAYNAGPGAVAQYGGVPPYSQTQNYVASITSMLGEQLA